ncbi:hypothetical protein ACEPAF_6049 [Sanghuangporus sanghuang]|uniref:Uncharacterized protein n=1 Tax=Sanghuangporus baumii TaxID=108892 RepID=A0A9Q5HWK1_SANBA|nr:hypothetical protein A7U60_g5588 [Sanghuangporus baumii]
MIIPLFKEGKLAGNGANDDDFNGAYQSLWEKLKKDKDSDIKQFVSSSDYRLAVHNAISQYSEGRALEELVKENKAAVRFLTLLCRREGSSKVDAYQKALKDAKERQNADGTSEVAKTRR